MSIAHWGPGEAPRDKLMERGASALSDAELLAVLLRTGYRNASALVLARELIAGFGSLSGVLAAPWRQVQDCRGMGASKCSQLQAAVELARRQVLESINRGDTLSSPQQTRLFLQYHLTGRDREVFSCLFLDSQHRVLRCEDLFFGTLDGAAVYPREVAVRALQYNAAAVILAHNHPSGVAEPSAADRRITERLQAALGLLDIRVLDHIIVGQGQSYSFAEQGLL